MTAELPLGHTAVMASRQEAKDSADFFPTPPWATRALFKHVLPQIGVLDVGSVWEPACGEGHMAKVIAEFMQPGEPVTATDLFDYGFGTAGYDFTGPASIRTDWIITNPPFNAAIEFAKLGLERAAEGVALLVRTQWLEGVRRYNELFQPTPPTLFAQFVERVPMVKGRWDPDASTATSYAWFVWLKGEQSPRTEVFWIPPGCRQALTKPDDRLRFGPPPDGVPLNVEPELVTAVSNLEGPAA
jgi:hypothetical protein